MRRSSFMKLSHSAITIIIMTILGGMALFFARSPFAAPTAPLQGAKATMLDRKPSGSTLTQQEVKALLQGHNRARAEVGVGPLSWSKQLANYAQEWATHLALKKCGFEHRPDTGEWRRNYGENLFMGTAGYYGVADAVKAWVNEKIYYKGETLTAGNFHASGHYTQVVWKDTKEVGCAKAECKGNIIVVCNYDPPGNVIGRKPY
jgi:pathogenesis-related protein 1